MTDTPQMSPTRRSQSARSQRRPKQPRHPLRRGCVVIVWAVIATWFVATGLVALWWLIRPELWIGGVRAPLSTMLLVCLGATLSVLAYRPEPTAGLYSLCGLFVLGWGLYNLNGVDGPLVGGYGFILLGGTVIGFALYRVVTTRQRS